MTAAISIELKKEASRIAKELQNAETALRQDLHELEKKVAEASHKLKSYSLAAERAKNIPVSQSDHSLCPNCWVINGNKSDLVGVNSPDNADLFECRVCGYSLSIPESTIAARQR